VRFSSRGLARDYSDVIIQLIGATTTNTGLTVTCDIDQSRYPKASKSAMPKWLPSTFSAITSKATGTTPSLQGNKHHPHAIIPHQILIASRAIIFCENSACVSHQKLRPLRGNPPSCPAGHSTGLRAGQQDRRQEGHGCSRPQAGRHPPSDVVRRQHLPLGRARKGMEILPNSAVRPLGFEIIAVYRRELSPA
jgi:hypothetical protein